MCKYDIFGTCVVSELSCHFYLQTLLCGFVVYLSAALLQGFQIAVLQVQDRRVRDCGTTATRVGTPHMRMAGDHGPVPDMCRNNCMHFLARTSIFLISGGRGDESAYMILDTAFDLVNVYRTFSLRRLV